MDITPDGKVAAFCEKPKGDGGWISGGFFVLEPEVLDYIEGDKVAWEREPLTRLAKEGRLHAYRQKEFWHPMDTLRDHHLLESLWSQGKAPWKVWK
jgi:glucose-1-phosphate cytidylyltransferase